eukprot:6197455-Pleurochrysis_carterae.AAC.1
MLIASSLRCSSSNAGLDREESTNPLAQPTALHLLQLYHRMPVRETHVPISSGVLPAYIPVSLLCLLHARLAVLAKFEVQKRRFVCCLCRLSQIASRTEYDKTIQETEAAYSK